MSVASTSATDADMAESLGDAAKKDFNIQHSNVQLLALYLYLKHRSYYNDYPMYNYFVL